MPPIRPPLHIAGFGDFGGGKSSFAATLPKPLLVFMFDAFGKDAPYVRRAHGGKVEVGVDERTGTPFQDCYSPKTGKRIIRIEYYHDQEPTLPDAYERFLARMTYFQTEYDQWKSVVIDSCTMMELTARKLHQYKLNPNPMASIGRGAVIRKGEQFDGRQWFSGSTDLVEEMLMNRFGALPMNVMVIAHINEDKDEVHGTFVRNPALPGRMARRLGAGYNEMWRFYVEMKSTERNRVIQTLPNQMFACTTSIQAPDGMTWTLDGGYSQVWEAYDAEMTATTEGR